MPEKLPPPKLFTPTFVRLLVVQMAFGASFSAFLLLPKFLRVELGASASAVGFVGGVALVVSALLAPFFGHLSRYIALRYLLAFALLCEGAAALGFVFVSRVGPEMILLRLLQGISWVLTYNAAAALCVNAVPRARMAEAIAYLGVSMLATNALAPLVTEPVAARWGWSTAFALAAIPPLLVLSLVPRLPRKAPVSDELRAASSLPSRATRWDLAACYYASLLMGAGISVMFTFVQPYALSQGATRVGTFFAGYMGAAVLVRLTLGRVTDRVGPRRVTLASQWLYALTVGAAAMLTPSTLLPLGAALGLAHGLLYPALTATALSYVSAEARPSFLGWFSCAFNSGHAVAALSLGALADARGYATVFLLMAGLILSGPLLFGLSRRLGRSASHRAHRAVVHSI